MARSKKKSSKKTCAGTKRNGRLKKGFKWSKKKGACPVPARKKR